MFSIANTASFIALIWVVKLHSMKYHRSAMVVPPYHLPELALVVVTVVHIEIRSFLPKGMSTCQILDCASRRRRRAS